MQYIQYKNGYFVLNQSILPDVIRDNKDHQNRVLMSVYSRFFNYKWGNKNQFQKFEEISLFAASVIEKILEENQENGQ